MSIEFKQVNYTYSPKSPFEYHALQDVNLTIRPNVITAVIGPTGSGKSTLVQHLNGLLLPQTGEVHILDKVVKAGEKPKGLKALRKDVGLVFQFPEAQLFEETILKDVMFGPINFGYSVDQAQTMAKQALSLVGIDESLYEHSPLDLSGGQKRRVAIAGIFAMNPAILVCDEPTAGLDPAGSKKMMKLFKDTQQAMKQTVLMVTHDLQHVLDYCDDVIVMEKGKIIFYGSVNSFFNDKTLCESLGLVMPKVIEYRNYLNQHGFNIPSSIQTISDLSKWIIKEVSDE